MPEITPAEIADTIPAVVFEWRTILDAAKAIAWVRARGTVDLPRGTESILVQSFAINARNLIDFLHYNPKGDYVRAAHYMNDPAAWGKSRSMTPTLQRARQLVDDEVAHITRKRAGKIEGSEWPIGKIIEDLEAELRAFVEAARRDGKFPLSVFVDFDEFFPSATGSLSPMPNVSTVANTTRTIPQHGASGRVGISGMTGKTSSQTGRESGPNQW